MRKIITIVLTVLILFSLSFGEQFVHAESISSVNQKIRELDQKKKEIESKRSNLQQDKKEISAKKQENLQQQKSVEEQLNEIESELAVTQSEIHTKQREIAATEKQINDLEAQIKQLRAEIADLKERIEKRNEVLKERLRSIQESGGKVQYLAVIFGAKSFTDFISRSTMVNTIMDQDRKIMEEQAADQAALEKKEQEVKEKKAQVEKEKKALVAQKDKLENLKATLDQQKQKQKNLQEQLTAEYAELEEAELTIEEEQQLIAAEAAIIEKARQLALQEKQRIEQEQAQANNGGGQQVSAQPSASGFIRPVAGRISSEYGWRTHPISGQRKFHNGIDIAGNNGYTVVAANSGVVAYAGWLGGYGNTVMIAHGNVTTLYAHLSSISVSVGQTVSRGQGIGTVGSTGRSTGPHLHFEVHPNGYGNGTANPRNYVNF